MMTEDHLSRAQRGQSREEIIADIIRYVRNLGTMLWSEWYVGRARDPEKSLFDEHAVRRQCDSWVCYRAFSAPVAQDVVAHFVSELGTDGDADQTDPFADAIYAYHKEAHTRP